MTSSCEIFELGDFTLQSGIVLSDARLAYKTYGELNAAKDNVVVLPTFYTGSHIRNEGFFGAGRAIDPEKHFIVSVNMFGNGISSSPSNTAAPQSGAAFPLITLYDNIKAQHLLLTSELQVNRIALVTGWSMAGCQSFQWAAQYPDMVDAILPFCASAKTAESTRVGHFRKRFSGRKCIVKKGSIQQRHFYKTGNKTIYNGTLTICYVNWLHGSTEISVSNLYITEILKKRWRQ